MSQGFLPQDWSSEGIVFVSRTGANAPAWNLWIHSFPAEGKPRPYLVSPFRKSHAQVSPNGKWLAFTTNETGTDQIVIQAFPDSTLGRRPVTTNGGTFPRWRKDGRELYYLASDRKLMAVQVKDRRYHVFGGNNGPVPDRVADRHPGHTRACWFSLRRRRQRTAISSDHATPIRNSFRFCARGVFGSIHDNSRLDFVGHREVGDLGTGNSGQAPRIPNSKLQVRGSRCLTPNSVLESFTGGEP